jgi:hypothetical protein
LSVPLPIKFYGSQIEHSKFSQIKEASKTN